MPCAGSSGTDRFAKAMRGDGVLREPKAVMQLARGSTISRSPVREGSSNVVFSFLWEDSSQLPASIVPVVVSSRAEPARGRRYVSWQERRRCRHGMRAANARTKKRLKRHAGQAYAQKRCTKQPLLHTPAQAKPHACPPLPLRALSRRESRGTRCFNRSTYRCHSSAQTFVRASTRQPSPQQKQRLSNTPAGEHARNAIARRPAVAHRSHEKTTLS